MSTNALRVIWVVLIFLLMILLVAALAFQVQVDCGCYRQPILGAYLGVRWSPLGYTGARPATTATKELRRLWMILNAHPVSGWLKTRRGEIPSEGKIASWRNNKKMDDRDRASIEERIKILESRLERLANQLEQLGKGFYDLGEKIANMKKKLDAVAELEKIRSIK